MAAAQLIGLDWGSSSLRAMRIAAGGELVEQRSAASGASQLSGGAAAFGAALDALIADWHGLDLPLLACGMVGSQHGWREAPYAACPAGAEGLLAAAVSVDWRGRELRLLPGLRCADVRGVPDVMRGEETQVQGALQRRPALAARSCIVMPGTHSKWAELRDAAVQGFATQMTGELFALLRQHSVLARLMPVETSSSSATAGSGEGFAAGVDAARDAGEAGLLHQLFAVRSLGLMQQLPPAELPDYLSGLLLGHELRAGLAWRAASGLADAPLQLVGEPALCARYALALQRFEQDHETPLPNTAADGLWRIAARAAFAG